MASVQEIKQQIKSLDKDGKEEIMRFMKIYIEFPPVDPMGILNNMLYQLPNLDSKLAKVKFVKDCTGWGLKASKDWFESIENYL